MISWFTTYLTRLRLRRMYRARRLELGRELIQTLGVALARVGHYIQFRKEAA